MGPLHTTILASGVAFAFAGSVALAASTDAPQIHEMTIRLPGGGVEHIAYTGNVAPQVVVAPVPFGVAWPAPLGLGVDPTLAAMERLSNEMNRQMNVMFQRAEAMAHAPLPQSQELNQAALRNMPPNDTNYSWISTSQGSNFCSHMTQIVVPADGKPRVTTQTSGNCGPNPGNASAQAPHATRKSNPI